MKRSIVAVAFLLSGCGGHVSRTDFNPNFVGTWKGPATIRVFLQNYAVDLVQTVSVNGSPNKLLFEDPLCPLTGMAISSSEAHLDPRDDCPTTVSAGCTLKQTYSLGRMLREGDKARLDLAGMLTISGCPGASNSDWRLNSDLMSRM